MSIKWAYELKDMTNVIFYLLKYDKMHNNDETYTLKGLKNPLFLHRKFQVWLIVKP